MATKIRSDGSNLSSSEKQVLEEVVKGEVIFKGEAPQEKLDDLLKRWNEVFTKPAVCQCHDFGRVKTPLTNFRRT